jgi:hypothetical protein
MRINRTAALATLGAVVLAVAIVLIIVFFTSPKSPKADGTDAPVDVVCLWVDGADPLWREQLQRTFKADTAAHPNCGLVHSTLREPEPTKRFAKDELFYSCMTIAKFMPWVHTYRLLTQRPHKPWWWPASGKLGNMRMVLVHHDEIFVGDMAKHLPMFNSVSIQTQLHRIPNLSEQFILFDDDFFVGQPMPRSLFFTDDNSKAVMRSYFMKPELLLNGNWKTICMNMVQCGKEILGGKPFYAPDHVACPLFKSVFAHVVTLVQKYVAPMHRFRSGTDIAIHYVVAAYMVAHDLTIPVPKWVRTEFLPVYQKERMDTFKDKIHMFCLNDRIQPADVKYLENLLK